MTEASITDSDILACLKEGERLEGRGYQGSFHTGTVGDHRIFVKAPAGDRELEIVGVVYL